MNVEIYEIERWDGSRWVVADDLGSDVTFRASSQEDADSTLRRWLDELGWTGSYRAVSR